MHGSILRVLVISMVCVSCGEEPSETDGDASSGTGASGSSGATSTDTEQPTVTSSDSSGPALGSTSDDPATTTGESADSGSSGEVPPLEGDVLQNDSWLPVDALEWQTWPGATDCWASVYQAEPAQVPFEVVGAIAAIGDGEGVHTFEVSVWEVSNQGEPTTELAGRTFEVDGATAELTEVDLTGLGLPAFDGNDEFALVMCHTAHMGPPSIAIDADGTVDAGRNWVRAQAMGNAWVPSPDFFDTDGDFILRAVIMPQA